MKKLHDMTKEELIARIHELENKYVWGLQVEDFASATVNVDEPIEDVYDIHSMSDEKLHDELFYRLKHVEQYNMHEWSEDISESAEFFTDETMKLLRTAAKRWLMIEEED